MRIATAEVGRVGVFHRRGFLAAGLAAAAQLPVGGVWARARATQSEAFFKALEERVGGRAGLAALDTQSGKGLFWRADERFAMCSSFKWLLAAETLSLAESHGLALDEAIPYSASALLGHSPVTAAHVSHGRMSVEALCAAAVEESDNGAANLLLARTGGPEALTAWLRRLGDATTRLDRNEPDLNENLPGDPRDTTTPRAMVKTMTLLLVGDGLGVDSRTRLLTWLGNCRTGANRLRKGVPQSWTEGDKTGTGARGAAVDNAIFRPPGRKPVLAAAYLSGSGRTTEVLETALAEIGRRVAQSFA
ncbi:MAG: class A beta-lactamase [Rhizomicrobium sp.]